MKSISDIYSYYFINILYISVSWLCNIDKGNNFSIPINGCT